MNPFSRSQTVTIILVAFFLLLIHGWSHYSRYLQSAESPQLFPVGAVVQLSGKVRAPGNYYFDQQVTVSEAVARAGGLLPPLKPEPGWTRERVANGRRLHIMADAGSVGKLRMGWMAVPSRLVLGELLDVNLASTAELAQVPGISQRLAERIAAQRNRLGGFSRLEDLRAVRGIGPISLKRLRKYLTVNGNQQAADSKQLAD
jgi:competence protein ComEA